MPSKKKSKTKQAKSKAPTVRKRATPRKGTFKARTGKSVKRKSSRIKKKGANRTRRNRGSVSPTREIKQEIRNRRLTVAEMGSGRQSDFQGVSRLREADSQSVDELVEEGNVFEAGAVAGVEEADNSDEREVRTHEVPEDD